MSSPCDPVGKARVTVVCEYELYDNYTHPDGTDVTIQEMAQHDAAMFIRDGVLLDLPGLIDWIDWTEVTVTFEAIEATNGASTAER